MKIISVNLTRSHVAAVLGTYLSDAPAHYLSEQAKELIAEHTKHYIAPGPLQVGIMLIMGVTCALVVEKMKDKAVEKAKEEYKDHEREINQDVIRAKLWFNRLQLATYASLAMLATRQVPSPKMVKILISRSEPSHLKAIAFKTIAPEHQLQGKPAFHLIEQNGELHKVFAAKRRPSSERRLEHTT